MDPYAPDFDTLLSLGHYMTREDFDLETITHSVNPNLGITSYLLKDPARPVFFPNAEISGSQYNIVGNLWATRDKVAAGLNIEKEMLPQALARAMQNLLPYKVVDSAPFQDNSLEPDLHNLPIVKYFHKDGGPYITAGIVIARDAEGKVNTSFHRMMTMDKNKFAVRIVKRHLHKIYEEAPEDLDVAVAVGLTPVVLLPAAMSLDYGVDELQIASSLCRESFGRPLEVVELDNGLPVPTGSEYVFTGRLLKERAEEGPFVDITGTYDIIRDEPVMQIDRVYHRNKPIFQALLPGANEHFLLMGLPREPAITYQVGQVVPEVKAVRLTEGGCCWLHGVVSIRKESEDDGGKAIRAAFKGHRSMKRVIIVDDDIDIFDDAAVEWAVATRFQADRDQVVIEERGSSLDPSRKEGDITAKLGFDATKPVGATDEYVKVL